MISTGGMLERAVRVAEQLEGDGIRVRVLSMHTLKPLDTEAVVRAGQETAAVVTLEEHSAIGGLGSAVAEVLAEAQIPRVRFRRLALPSAFASTVGSQDYLRDAHGLSEQAILAELRGVLAAQP